MDEISEYDKHLMLLSKSAAPMIYTS